jgi:hypothetical protein
VVSYMPGMAAGKLGHPVVVQVRPEGGQVEQTRYSPGLGEDLVRAKTTVEWLEITEEEMRGAELRVL